MLPSPYRTRESTRTYSSARPTFHCLNRGSSSRSSSVILATSVEALDGHLYLPSLNRPRCKGLASLAAGPDRPSQHGLVHEHQLRGGRTAKTESGHRSTLARRFTTFAARMQDPLTRCDHSSIERDTPRERGRGGGKRKGRGKKRYMGRERDAQTETLHRPSPRRR